MKAVGFRFLDIMIRQQKEKASLTKLICFLMKQLCDVSVTHPPTHPHTSLSFLENGSRCLYEASKLANVIFSVFWLCHLDVDVERFLRFEDFGVNF